MFCCLNDCFKLAILSYLENGFALSFSIIRSQNFSMEYLKSEDLLKKTAIYQYHEQTKHTVKKLTSGGHFLDWANQPNPFLEYKGAPSVELSRDVVDLDFSLPEAVKSFLLFGRENLQEKRTDLKNLSGDDLVSNLLFYGVSISAWKQIKGTGNRWALRMNASSGNLHPTETSVLIGESFSGSLEPGLYHYKVRDHKLEARIKGEMVSKVWKQLGYNTTPPVMLICLSSIFWREAWKYRERAFRYCHLDLGHALASLSMSAASLGWQSYISSLFVDQDMVELLGLSDSPEKPLAFIALSQGESDTLEALRDRSVQRSYFKETELPENQGSPIELSSEVINYPSISQACETSTYEKDSFQNVLKNNFESRDIAPGTIKPCEDQVAIDNNFEEVIKDLSFKSMSKTVRTRRSAVAMDGKTSMTLKELSAILSISTSGYLADYEIPDRFDGININPEQAHYLVQPYLYIHRVKGLDSGLYFFDRQKRALIPLSLHDQKEVAQVTSCFQEIASDGAFAMSMIADLNYAYKKFGARGYGLAHNEAGFLGQMLYLSSNALGYEATGIGCFIDDMINEYLVLDAGFEVIYNFTVGRAVLDDRLTTLPAYPFLND